MNKIKEARATDSDGGVAPTVDPDEASKKDPKNTDNLESGFDDDDL